MTTSARTRIAISPLWAAVVGASTISFSAIFFELAAVSAETGALFRFLYAIPVLGVLGCQAMRGRPRRGRIRLLAIAAGVMLALDVIMWHLAIGDIGTGLATVIVNCQVIFVALLAWVLLGERPSRRVFTAVPVMLAGVALVSGLGQASSFGDNPMRGTLFAVAGGFFYAVFLLAYRRSNTGRDKTAPSLFDATIGALLATAIVGATTGSIQVPATVESHLWLLALAIGTQVVGWLIIGYALPRLPAAETSAVILLQPVATMVWGALIFSERPSLLQLGGALLVLSGVALVATTRRA